jgi:hypothetical protein
VRITARPGGRRPPSSQRTECAAEGDHSKNIPALDDDASKATRKIGEAQRCDPVLRLDVRVHRQRVHPGGPLGHDALSLPSASPPPSRALYWPGGVEPQTLAEAVDAGDTTVQFEIDGMVCT